MDTLAHISSFPHKSIEKRENCAICQRFIETGYKSVELVYKTAMPFESVCL